MEQSSVPAHVRKSFAVKVASDDRLDVVVDVAVLHVDHLSVLHELNELRTACVLCSAARSRRRRGPRTARFCFFFHLPT
jgi:hypothetical protein